MSLLCFRQCQYFHAILSDEDGVLELRGPPTIEGRDGPTVIPNMGLLTALGEHRFDGKYHSGAHRYVVRVAEMLRVLFVSMSCRLRTLAICLLRRPHLHKR